MYRVLSKSPKKAKKRKYVFVRVVLLVIVSLINLAKIMQEIRIIKNYNLKRVIEKHIFTIQAKSKKDFYKQITILLNNNLIDKEWGLWGINKYHKWFRD